MEGGPPENKTPYSCREMPSYSESFYHYLCPIATAYCMEMRRRMFLRVHLY